MPQPFNNAVMTDGGARLLTMAQAGEIRIQFTRMAIGNGVYSEEEKTLSALQSVAALKSEKNSYALSDVSVFSEHSVKLTAIITNQDPVSHETLIHEGFYINELGILPNRKVKTGWKTRCFIALQSRLEIMEILCRLLTAIIRRRSYRTIL